MICEYILFYLYSFNIFGQIKDPLFEALSLQRMRLLPLIPQPLSLRQRCRTANGFNKRKHLLQVIHVTALYYVADES